MISRKSEPKLFLLINYLRAENTFNIKNKTNHPISSKSPHSATTNKTTHSLKKGGWLQNQQEHHVILTEYEAVHPTAISGNNLHQDSNILDNRPNN